MLIACHQHVTSTRNSTRRLISSYSMSDKIHDQIIYFDRFTNFSDAWYIHSLRMNRNAFARLCYLLCVIGALVDSRHIRVEEKVAMFVNILAHHHKNCTIKLNFLRSWETISRHSHTILNAI